MPALDRLPRGAAASSDRQALQADPQGRVLEGRREEHLSHPYFEAAERGTPIAIAHRGGSSSAPENTLASFEHAWSLGYRYLETDVHLTTDGVLVAFHDPDLRRTCDVDGNIAEMSSEELAEARVGGEHPIPLMAELLERFPEAVFNIDAKSDEAVDPLIALIRRTAAERRVCLGAFSLRRLRRMRRAFGGEVPSCLAPSETAGMVTTGRLPGSSRRVAQVPPNAGRVSVVTERFVRSARRIGLPVHVWTINERAEMERLLDLGVDGIMTDETELLASVFAERGLALS